MDRVAEPEIVPNLQVFISLVGLEIEEHVDKYSQSGYCFSIITYLKNIYIHNETEFRKTTNRTYSACLNLK